MKRIFLVFAVAVAFALLAISQRRGSDVSLPLAKTESEKKILAVLDEMQRTGKTYLSVPVADGRFRTAS